MQVDTAPLYGATYTAKTTYRRRRAPKRVKRRARRSFKTFMKNTMRLQNPANSLNSGSFAVTSTADQQNWFSFDLCNTNALRALVANQQAAANPGNAALRDMRLALKTFRLTVTIANSGTNTNPVLMDLYTIVPRRDIDFDEFSDVNGLNGNVLAQYFKNGALPVATDNGGELQAPEQAGDVTPTFRVVGFTPFMYPAFCRMFKIVNIKTVKLPIGESYISHYKVSNKMLNPTRFLTKEASLPAPAKDPLSKIYLAGTSMSILACFRGLPTASNGSGESAMRVRWEEQSTTKYLALKRSSVSRDTTA